MFMLNLLVLFSIESTFAGNYNIFRSACRNYAVFKATDRNIKVKGGLISVFHVNSLPHCVRKCLAVSNCLTFNFSPTTNQENCEILTSSRTTGGTLEAATNWNHYEALFHQITPGCHVAGESSACSPGQKCEDVCQGDSRFKCIDIDECASSPCLNGGNCNNLANRYQCSCAPGYTGTRCQADINECASSPCQNGGGCHNHLNHFTCSCVNGFTGSRCETAPPGGWWG